MIDTVFHERNGLLPGARSAAHCPCVSPPPVPGLRLEERRAFALPAPLLEEIASARWKGEPNRLSKDHHPWPVIDEVALATEKTGPPQVSTTDLAHSHSISVSCS